MAIALFQPHLGTQNPVEAVKFYCPLFGWTFRLNDRRAESISFFCGRREVATSFPLVAGFDNSSGGCYPAFWVESAAKHTERAASLGAQILTRRDTGKHRSTVLASPTGEVFALIEGSARRGADDGGSADAMLEVVTPDARATKTFYESLFGFEARSRGGRGALYAADGSRVSNISEFYDNWSDHAFLSATGRAGAGGRSVPPHWMVYFCVSNLDDALSRARFLGASIVVRHELDPGLLPAALIQDPAGHYWSLIGSA